MPPEPAPEPEPDAEPEPAFEPEPGSPEGGAGGAWAGAVWVSPGGAVGTVVVPGSPGVTRSRSCGGGSVAVASSSWTGSG